MSSERQIKGDKYEAFSQDILLLKSISWTKQSISFDIISDEGVIEGKSGAAHQIDVHLVSSKHPEYHLLCECKCFSKAISKTLACSFVTVINDIKKKHKEWKIIPVFTSDKGFQSGAKAIFKQYNISFLDLEDISDRKIALTIEESSVRAVVKINKIVLKDGNEAKIYDGFVNDDLGDIRGAKDIVRYYHVYDSNGHEINDLVHHVGYFKTGDRLFIKNKYDVFKHFGDEKEIDYIEGEIEGNIRENHGRNTSVFDSVVKAKLKLENGDSYQFFKDGGIKRLL